MNKVEQACREGQEAELGKCKATRKGLPAARGTRDGFIVADTEEYRGIREEFEDIKGITETRQGIKGNEEMCQMRGKGATRYPVDYRHDGEGLQRRGSAIQQKLPAS